MTKTENMTDWSILFLRAFIGGFMLMHNVGKIQDYDEIINSYPSFLIFGQQAVFMLGTLIEVLLSVLIIIGLNVRSAAALLTGICITILIAFHDAEYTKTVLMMGIYMTLVLSGSGRFGFDPYRKSVKKEN